MAALAATGPGSAHAVVGGRTVPSGHHPAVVHLSGCSGTLIAPDRVLTAAHCVGVLSEMPRVLGRRIVRVSWHPRYTASTTAPGYRHGDERGDLAVLGLDAPVRGVLPVRLLRPGEQAAVAAGRRLRVLGYGYTRHRGLERGRLHQAAMTVESSARCARRWHALGGQYRRAWESSSMLCLRDPDERAPHVSICHGDSGGPVLARTGRGWVVAGVNSWGGRRCGSRGDPSVASRVLGDGFLARRDPIWAPTPLPGSPRVRGTPQVGATLTCEIPGWASRPDRVEFQWMINRRGGVVRTSQPTYLVAAPDRGRAVWCLAVAYNEGGKGTTPASSRVRVP